MIQKEIQNAKTAVDLIGKKLIKINATLNAPGWIKNFNPNMQSIKKKSKK